MVCKRKVSWLKSGLCLGGDSQCSLPIGGVIKVQHMSSSHTGTVSLCIFGLFHFKLFETVFFAPKFYEHEIRQTGKGPVRALLKNIWTKTLEESNLLVFMSFAMEHVQEGHDGNSLMTFYFVDDKYSEILPNHHRITIR